MKKSDIDKVEETTRRITQPKTVNLIYIGEEFYNKSGTVMSSIYKVSGERYDFGFVQRDLQNGLSVNIRPAMSHELAFYNGQLTMIEYKRERRKLEDG